MPGSLLGIWKTTVPKYAGHFFEISTDIVVFATGDGETAVHPIASVEMVPEGQRRLYTVIPYWFSRPPQCSVPLTARCPRAPGLHEASQRYGRLADC